MFFVFYEMWSAFLFFCLHSVAAQSQCKIVQRFADCSHLKLKEIPSDLPVNITELKVSHNQLKALSVGVLSRYSQLTHLDAGYNLIAKVEEGLCTSLPLLEVLNLQHNVIYHLTNKFFQFCSNLTVLFLQYNKIPAITNDPFLKLQNLKILDVSHNALKSPVLGQQQQQLPNLKELVLSSNSITRLKKEDLTALSNTSLIKLDLSANPLTKFEPGCLRTLQQLDILVMDSIMLGLNLTEELCMELENTSIKMLSLRKVNLSRIASTTFAGLEVTQLKVLDLSENTLSLIEDNSFKWLESLEYLNLHDNRISHISVNTFSGLNNLTHLNLKKSLRTKNATNIGSRIDDYSFQHLKSLKQLIMEDNIFPRITVNMFSGLFSLIYLSLANCSTDLNTVTNATFSSLSNSPLEILNLTRTKISKLEKEAFSSLTKLRKLYVGFNAIAQTLRGDEFKGLVSIKEIYLSNNIKVTLTSYSFSQVPTLSILMLSRTKVDNLEKLTPSPFKPLQNLTILDLSNNNLANLNDELFNGLHGLEILKLEHNNLARLWKQVNPGGPVLFLKGLTNLHVLQLSRNGFDEIPVDAFRGLDHLVHLDLDSNNLNFLPDTVFDGLRSLKLLSLRKNLITSVPRGVFGSVFQKLETLQMAFNPFDCTCESISWFVNWLNGTNTSIPELSSHYICNTPQKYHNASVTTFDTSPCKDVAPFYVLFTVTLSVLLLIIVTSIFTKFQGWRMEFYWHVIVNRVLGYREIDPLEVRFEYDAYIIHAKKDNDWVVRNLLPLEENDVRFCFEERDFESGRSEMEAIVNSIKESRKIVFVVTREILEDPWCKRFKIYHAVHQAIEQSRDSMVVIFLEDIPDYKLYHGLCLRRGMFKSHCILHWPAQKERVKAFHQNLKVAIGSSKKAVKKLALCLTKHRRNLIVERYQSEEG
ncbi:toll-like receptor 3 [Protopterus annectens]|uniref:toll-like receptor 3 n=1 Tax=Protopterus annectens TaxID=7888 RepID=UPI001CFA3B79|nr:toll-like receptor 3 [Protopterus annectens]